MEAESAKPVTTIPVHISQPEDHAPPTLAEPASGPVAEMSGALQGGEKPVSEPAVEAAGRNQTLTWAMNIDES